MELKIVEPVSVNVNCQLNYDCHYLLKYTPILEIKKYTTFSGKGSMASLTLLGKNPVCL